MQLRCSPRGSVPAGEGRSAIRADRRWLARARRLDPSAPAWARTDYARSLLVLRALVDRRTGAVPAAPRDHWHHVWPRDSALVAIALRKAGYPLDAERVVGFLERLALDRAARFDGAGRAVRGRAAPGDSAGWLRAAGGRARPLEWRGRDDYWENGPGDRLANALAAGAPVGEIRDGFGSPRGLHREPGARGGLESAAAWAVVPFRRTGLRESARHTLLVLASGAGRFGIRPGSAWSGPEPWTAPTAWSAWALAELGEERAADRLLGALRQAATPAGTLPERVHPRTGIALSATPLAWSHAAHALALLARYG